MENLKNSIFSGFSNRGIFRLGFALLCFHSSDVTRGPYGPFLSQLTHPHLILRKYALVVLLASTQVGVVRNFIF
jgi:hypothetical protein